jgi:hypothetical protein
MQESIYKYLSGDHDRLDGLLGEATVRPEAIDRDLYAEFRKGLLRHIAMEEKLIFPVIARLRGGDQPVFIEQLHLDHGALVALLVPPPAPLIIRMLRTILKVHNAREEQEGGLYLIFEKLVESERDTTLVKLKICP